MNRVNELMASMQSFGKDSYKKSELLKEMLALQKEIVDLTYNGKHTSTADMKIWDALQRFIDGSKTFCSLIKTEISGTGVKQRHSTHWNLSVLRILF